MIKPELYLPRVDRQASIQRDEWLLCKEGCNCVGVQLLLIDRRGRFLAVQEGKTDANTNPGEWGLIGGKTRWRSKDNRLESVFNCGRRELLTEAAPTPELYKKIYYLTGFSPQPMVFAHRQLEVVVQVIPLFWAGTTGFTDFQNQSNGQDNEPILGYRWVEPGGNKYREINWRNGQKQLLTALTNSDNGSINWFSWYERLVNGQNLETLTQIGLAMPFIPAGYRDFQGLDWPQKEPLVSVLSYNWDQLEPGEYDSF